PLLHLVRRNLASSGVLELSTGVIGGLVGFIWHFSPVWTLAMVCPAGIAYVALRFLHRIVTETDSAVETIAQIVDERDHYTYEYSGHVAEYAGLLANAMRLDA